MDIDQAFSFTYHSMGADEIHRLLGKIERHKIGYIIIVGNPLKVEHFVTHARGKNLVVRVVPEEMLVKNFWLTVIAEMLSVD